MIFAKSGADPMRAGDHEHRSNERSNVIESLLVLRLQAQIALAAANAEARRLDGEVNDVDLALTRLLRGKNRSDGLLSGKGPLDAGAGRRILRAKAAAGQALVDVQPRARLIGRRARLLEERQLAVIDVRRLEAEEQAVDKKYRELTGQPEPATRRALTLMSG